MGRRMLVTAFCALVCGQHLVGTAASADWTTYTTADGMAYDPVAAIEFALDGRLWCVHVVEGGGGISHFDGATWTHYTTEDGLASDVILWTDPLAVTPDGVLWVGTFGGGVSRFDGQTWTTFTTEDGLLSDAVTAVALAPNGDLWCGHPVPYGGTSRFDCETWTAYPASEIGLPNDNVLSIAVTPDGRLWVGGVGVSCFDGETWTYHSFEEMGAAEVGDYGVMSLAVGPDGALWVGTDRSGVYRYDGESWASYAEDDGLAGSPVMSIVVAPDGALWFGRGEGISRYPPGPTSVRPMSWIARRGGSAALAAVVNTIGDEPLRAGAQMVIDQVDAAQLTRELEGRLSISPPGTAPGISRLPGRGRVPAHGGARRCCTRRPAH